jgi:hypothetical protein
MTFAISANTSAEIAIELFEFIACSVRAEVQPVAQLNQSIWQVPVRRSSASSLRGSAEFDLLV